MHTRKFLYKEQWSRRIQNHKRDKAASILHRTRKQERLQGRQEIKQQLVTVGVEE